MAIDSWFESRRIQIFVFSFRNLRAPSPHRSGCGSTLTCQSRRLPGLTSTPSTAALNVWHSTRNKIDCIPLEFCRLCASCPAFLMFPGFLQNG